MSFFFFFQAEDGIRDLTVTGVQTCALPIYVPRDAIGAVLEAQVVHLEPGRAGADRGRPVGVPPFLVDREVRAGAGERGPKRVIVQVRRVGSLIVTGRLLLGDAQRERVPRDVRRADRADARVRVVVPAVVEVRGRDVRTAPERVHGGAATVASDRRRGASESRG